MNRGAPPGPTGGGLTETLVFDIGGTSVRAGAYDPVGDALVGLAVVEAELARTWEGDPAERFVHLAGILEDAAARIGLLPGLAERVVVAFPGPVAPGGVVVRAPTLWPGETFAPYPLEAYLRSRWHPRVVVVNDVTAAGYAFVTEVRRDFCIVTVSSGVGHKIFVDGHPVVGRSGMGGEIGHVRAPGAFAHVPCDCGGAGHLGAVASGRGMTAAARRAALDDAAGFAASSLAAAGGPAGGITADDLARAYRGGDAWAAGVVQACTAPLGWILATMHAAVGVEDFVIVGGFAEALGPAFLATVATTAAESSWAPSRTWPEMIQAGGLDGTAGLVGGGRLSARS